MRQGIDRFQHLCETQAWALLALVCAPPLLWPFAAGAFGPQLMYWLIQVLDP
ncbi:hypothetical protein [Salinisphaera shabanensis]|uniref:hypothetical protein n=1 Tax=Salinisphaera shabanensis TaxID=180542 RepID=UPI003342C6B3